jgi:hypothetical protein
MSLTHENITECVNYIKDSLHISYEKDIIIDPCAVKGVLIKELDGLVRYSFYYDVETNHPAIELLDFLHVDFQKFDKTILAGLWYDKVHVISYPSDLDALSYLQKCAEFADTISFIMPEKYAAITLGNYELLFKKEIKNDYSVNIWKRK